MSVEELEGCMTRGDTMAEAARLGFEAVELVLETMVSKKIKVPEPISKIKASGEFIVRSTPELHKHLIEKAQAAGYKTLNKFIVSKLREL